MLFGARNDIKKWLMNWKHFILSIFIKLNIYYENMNWVDTFYFFAQYDNTYKIKIK